MKKQLKGRFAPSPSGDLHFGSLVAAVASYLEIKKTDGEWLVRVEDIDPPRIVEGASSAILQSLESHHLYWDGEVSYQSKRIHHYQEVMENLKRSNLIYGCECSRKQLKGVYPYPKLCRNLTLPINHISTNQRNYALRIKTKSEEINMSDLWLGDLSWNMESDIGDSILQRADGIFSYHLAVVVDDFLQGITQVIRGSDLLDSTPIHIHLQQLLGYNTPQYGHIPTATNSDGVKLSKQYGAKPLNNNSPLDNIFLALQFLGANPPSKLRDHSLDTLWSWALENWKTR
ncbi:MAG: tRNA glutamyl-Q(34) synthetase GluQRS [Thiotrichales bacterium]|nr:tRNA glutamyl-Q(34) synthetase GluQRS [Thiotrichales bacterium]MBT3613841.1 tRNA glutamyl-Q(34) synthetase GluQRS [Thiotrichales bacterium]MBT3752846.1 tRNA glutamyl-Q(34) synthetase GluQRS [Thiotrichales bacterium]MBT3838246.1 tRNA glutamyl-Q(34) synthetase GluQRS [Thiotrichales bacterium]MBT4151447.1 tRNA glutamyl-Q(34) synthetase GluQRS [Thiotrichales bacterium]